MSKNKKFESPKFNGKSFAMLKLKIHDILVKDDCTIALNGSEAKTEGMIDGQFASKDEVDRTDILLDLEDNILSNVKSAHTIAKEL